MVFVGVYDAVRGGFNVSAAAAAALLSLLSVNFIIAPSAGRVRSELTHTLSERDTIMLPSTRCR